ncbi:hypothetical protein SAMN05660642_04786 [Geodermatophilus siccatus]|uniref:Uncharacterized protein n=1 Tax=Geodermatophilus siccatus TaxID=1137991 RepID=A0A1H0B5A0_9ACTN|nr:hypothetical protein SAMN05660642_04786 [Geodermatophilus siccatus]
MSGQRTTGRRRRTRPTRGRWAAARGGPRPRRATCRSRRRDVGSPPAGRATTTAPGGPGRPRDRLSWSGATSGGTWHGGAQGRARCADDRLGRRSVRAAVHTAAILGGGGTGPAGADGRRDGRRPRVRCRAHHRTAGCPGAARTGHRRRCLAGHGARHEGPPRRSEGGGRGRPAPLHLAGAGRRAVLHRDAALGSGPRAPVAVPAWPAPQRRQAGRAVRRCRQHPRRRGSTCRMDTTRSTGCTQPPLASSGLPMVGPHWPVPSAQRRVRGRVPACRPH